ncbi:MarR family transcriptional regulator [Actinoplanes derwentensis]|nr:MarR family transcriptional regulator [Actinoplanes derwentensis]
MRTAAAPGDLLLEASDARQTGALVVGGHPGGAVYVVEGRVMYAESPAAPGVGELLTSSGRLAGRTWQQALDIGGSTARVGRLLVEQGHLTQGELELCVLGSTYDAAYFVLSERSAPAEFRTGATHWLGQVVHIDAAAVEHEVRRRIQLLDEIFPNPRIDVAPVIPVPRPPRARVTITAPQWELLVHADGQRTPADLAQLLGRAGYAIIQELRRMAAAGLIEQPAERAPETHEFVRLPHPRGSSAPLGRPAVAPVSPPVIAGPAPPARNPPDPPVIAPAVPPPAVASPPDQNAGTNRPRLARRKPGAKLPKEVAGESPPVHQGTDEVLLKRIRTALRALR